MLNSKSLDELQTLLENLKSNLKAKYDFDFDKSLVGSIIQELTEDKLYVEIKARIQDLSINELLLLQKLINNPLTPAPAIEQVKELSPVPEIVKRKPGRQKKLQ